MENEKIRLSYDKSFLQTLTKSKRKGGRPKEKITARNVLDNHNRTNIFRLCKEPQNFTKLKKLTKLSTGALFHHLRVLEKLGIINQKTLKEGEKRKRGNEVVIRSDEEKYNSLLKKESDKRFGGRKKFNQIIKHLCGFQGLLHLICYNHGGFYLTEKQIEKRFRALIKSCNQTLKK